MRTLYERYRGVVQGGPFAGLILPEDVSWGEKTAALCIVGSYEEELHDCIETLVQRQPARIVNVGSAEGYYAVGFARRVPSADVWAFDVNPAAQKLVSVTAALNGVAARVHVGGLCTPADLQELIDRDTVLVIDCEGCEDGLLDLDAVPELRHATMLVELHDFIDASLGQRVLARFRTTHAATVFPARPRDPSRYPALAALPRRDRPFAVDEARPAEPRPMRWAFLEPRAVAYDSLAAPGSG
jgi:hypothetical protein